MGTFYFEADPKLPACTITTLSGRKIRIHEYASGELRFKMTGPMAIIEAVLGSDPVSVTFAPGWNDNSSKFQGAIRETLVNARRMEAITSDIISSASGLIFWLTVTGDPTKSPQQKAQAAQCADTLVTGISTAFDQTTFLTGIRAQLGNIAYDLRRLGQMTPLKEMFSRCVAAWNGVNHMHQPVAAIFSTVTVLMSNLATHSPKGIEDRWRSQEFRLPDIFKVLMEVHNELLKREGPSAM